MFDAGAFTLRGAEPERCQLWRSQCEHGSEKHALPATLVELQDVQKEDEMMASERGCLWNIDTSR